MGVVRHDFPLSKKNMALKHCMLPNDLCRHAFLFNFGWEDPSQLGSWPGGYVKPLKLYREAI